MPIAHQPGPRERAGDPPRGLRRRADPRRAHLALPVHGVGHGQGPAREGALRHLPRPVRARQPRQLGGLPAGRRRARPRARRPHQLRGRQLPRRADRPAHLHHRRRQERLLAAADHCPRDARSDDAGVVGVSFRAGKVSVGEDTEAPFEATIPEQALRDELPDSAKVLAQALFEDGRRLAFSADPARVRQVSRRAAVAVATALATGALAVASGCGGGDEPNPAITPDPAYGAQPNIVFIYTDDQDYSSFNRRIMPHTFADIVDHGSDFTNYYDATPLCCPARAGVLTGQYGHNNGVLSNKPGYGDLADNENTLPVWLQRAGYRTAIAGQVPQRLRERGRRQGRRRARLGPVVGRDRQRARLLRLQARRERPPAQGGLQGPVPHQRDQRARGGGRPPALRRPAVLPLGDPERAARREHQREQRRPVRRRVGAPAARPRPLRRHAAAATARACSSRTSPTSPRSSAASRASARSSAG